MLAPPGWSISSFAVPMLTATTGFVALLPFSHTIHLAMLNMPARLSLTADIFLKDASIYEVSEKIAPS